ncbi:MAG: TIGR00730 family Rossman fold protein [Acidimicrobiaceae bacterium]
MFEIDQLIANTASDELLLVAKLFGPWRSRKKVLVFGSARTAKENPLYQLTKEFGQIMTKADWMSITGAGGGIMEATSEGAGHDHTIGVNIKLPFEQHANPFIDAANKVVSVKNFFTRKVSMIREADAFVCLPGGFGTLDELYEVLTLIHTGKSTPAPVVLIDAPGGTFWSKWLDFLETEIIGGAYISQPDSALVKLCTSAESAAEEIFTFYSNYVDCSFSSGEVQINLLNEPTDSQVQSLLKVTPQLSKTPLFTKQGSSITASFEGRNYVGLRLVINEINSWA